MSLLQFPKPTEYGRVIPKNSFDSYTTSKQKKLISDTILRITWTNKLSTETTNLLSKELKEVQLIHIELKIKSELKNILDLIDKSIPYHIIFTLEFDSEILFSTSAKHNHLSKINESVIDCTFKSQWRMISDNKVQLKLSNTIEQTYIDFCNQLSGRNIDYQNYTEFIKKEIEIANIETKIRTLESQVRREKQFKIKVDLNESLNSLKNKLQQLISS